MSASTKTSRQNPENYAGQYHKARYWHLLAKCTPEPIPHSKNTLYLANLVIRDPISWWTKRAIRKAVCALIAQSSLACLYQIMVGERDASCNFIWRGLLHDRCIMKCFRFHLTGPQYKQLAALAKSPAERTMHPKMA